MAKSNHTKKQIDAEIQVTLQQRPAWKLTEECKVYRCKLQRLTEIINYNYLHPNIRSSHQEVFCEKGVLKTSQNSQEKTIPESRFHLDYLLLFLRFPLLTLSIYLFAGKSIHVFIYCDVFICTIFFLISLLSILNRFHALIYSFYYQL